MEDIHVEPQFKKRRFTDFVFRRVLEPEQDGVVPSVTSVQGLQARHRVASARTFAASSCEHTGEGSLKSIRRGEEDPPSLGSSLQSSPEPTVKDVSSAPMGLGELEDESNIIQTAISQYTRAPPIHNIRRFHLTRLLKPTPQGPTGGVQKLKRQRKGDATLLFEEVLSDSKLRTPRKDDRPRGADNDDTIRVALPPDQQSKTVTLNDAHLAENNPACIALPQSGTSSVDINTAADDLDVEMADLPGPLRDLLAEELKSRHPEQKPREPQLKYKPTAPAQRYRNRCDYVKIEVRSADKGDAIQEKDSDGDYIYDTYVREFREQSSGTNWPGKSIGVLVFDQETQAEWELLEEEKSDKDYNSDEEDSNGMRLTP